jgi:hypothetical protein
MCFSNDGGAYSGWEAFSTSKSWNLAAFAGVRTVYFKARNSTYETGPVSDTITYVIAPSGLTISIDSGATDTGSTGVTLTLAVITSPIDAAQVFFDNVSVTVERAVLGVEPLPALESSWGKIKAQYRD